MDFFFWAAFAMTVLYSIGVLYNWDEMELRSRSLSCLALLLLFLFSVGTANEWGRSDIPLFPINVAKPLKTGQEYTVLGTYQAPKGTVVIVQDTKGTIRTLLTRNVPPPHFVVTDDDHVLALK